jgi:hypothetical protein
MSAPQIPAALTAISSSPASAQGRGQSAISTFPADLYMSARTNFPMADLNWPPFRIASNLNVLNGLS